MIFDAAVCPVQIDLLQRATRKREENKHKCDETPSDSDRIDRTEQVTHKTRKPTKKGTTYLNVFNSALDGDDLLLGL